MKFSIGCDIEEIERFKRKISDENFLRKVYTETEMEYCLSKANPAQHFTARWCAKEAIIKAFYGLGISLADFTKIEIVNNTEGYPEVSIHDTRCKGFETKISISHSGGVAMATAILMKGI